MIDELKDILTTDPSQWGSYAGSHQYGDSFEKIEKRIASGEVPVYSKPHFLCLDLDSKEELDTFHKRLDSFTTMVGWEDKFEISSPSGRGFHVYILLKQDYSIAERIAMQAVLGSDPLREMLSLYKFTKGERTGTEDDFKDNPTWLFEKDPGLLPPWTKPGWKRPAITSLDGLLSL